MTAMPALARTLYVLGPVLAGRRRWTYRPVSAGLRGYARRSRATRGAVGQRTSCTQPSFSKIQIRRAEMSISQGRTPCAGRLPDGPDWGREPTERWGRLIVDGRSEPVPRVPGAHPDFYTGVVAMLRHGAPPPVDPADAVATLTVLEAARRSADERSVVTLGDAR